MAVVQLAIALGSTVGGLVFDTAGYRSTFALSAALLLVASFLAFVASRWQSGSEPTLALQAQSIDYKTPRIPSTHTLRPTIQIMRTHHVPGSSERAISLRAACFLLGLLMLGGSQAAASGSGAVATAGTTPGAPAVQPKESRMWMTVGERRFAVTLADTAAARAFAERLPMTLDMPDLNNNEKHVTLPKPLPANASRPGTIRAGDLMLYGTDTFVVFYLTFDSSYSYTRIGRVDDPAGLARALGPRDVRVAFSRD